MDVRLCFIMSTLALVFGSQKIQHCKEGSLINVILLNDDESPWSMKFVKGEVLKAIKLNSQINAAAGK